MNLADYRPLVLPVFLAVGLVLLVACANVANLLLSRATTRQREVSIRLALGSSRARLIRQLLTESMLLALLGGTGALLLSFWTVRTTYPVILFSLPLPRGFAETFLFDPQPDAGVFIMALLLSLATGMVFGLVPALQTSQVDLASGFKGDSSRPGQRLSRARMRNTLVVVQVAVGLVLLISAGLLVRSVRELEQVDVGLATKGVLSAAAGRSGENNTRQENELRRQLLRRLNELPEVVAAGEARSVPLTGSLASAPVSLPGQDSRTNSILHSAAYNLVSPGYFETVGPCVLRGRIFTQQEFDADAPVVVISESTANRFWPGEDPIGKRITIGSAADAAERKRLFLPDREVVGVVGDARSAYVWQRDGPMLYLPAAVDAEAATYLLVRMAGTQSLVSPEDVIRREAHLIDGNLQISIRAIDESLEYQMWPFRTCAVLAGALGMMALLMATIGLYGVISYLVGQRTHEFGIRLALGATPRELLQLVLQSGMRLVLAGTAVGMACAAIVTRLFKGVLLDFSPLDPLTYGIVALLVAAVALVACAIPARRAAGVDPIVALRHE